MANAQTSHIHTIENPGFLKGVGSLKTGLSVLAVVGLVVFFAGLRMDPTRLWAAFLVNHFYFMGIALCAGFFAAIHWLTSSMWTSPVRRLMEAMTAYLPFALFATAILYFGIHDLYVWSHPEVVAADQALQGKAGYLSVRAFMLRGVLGLGFLIFMAHKLVRNSLAQDKNPGMILTRKNKSLAPAFIISYALIFSLISVDELMSLDPHWYSTMFGVYTFAGSFYAQIALTTLMVLHFRARGQLGNAVNDNHLHDLGKYMFGMTIFYAYIAFSQFMLIWYANIPEETSFFIHRIHGCWLYFSIFLIAGKFLVPFLALLTRESKRCVYTLTAVAIFMLVAHWIDILWLVQPNFFIDGPHIGWMELGMAAGFVGVFGLLTLSFLTRHNVIAIGDPRLDEAAFHHHL